MMMEFFSVYAFEEINISIVSVHCISTKIIDFKISSLSEHDFVTQTNCNIAIIALMEKKK